MHTTPQGRADVRYEKPKDAKPLGFEGYTPTQIAAYMGKHQCLELLLQHHTLFAEEEIVKPARILPRALYRHVVVPVLRAITACRRRRQGRGRGRSWGWGKTHHNSQHLPVAPDTIGSRPHASSMPPALASAPAPVPSPPLAMGLQQQQQPPLSAPGAMQGGHHSMHRHHHHGQGDSLALDADAGMALRRALHPAGPHQGQGQAAGGEQQQQHQGHHHALDDEISMLVNLAFCSWSRDCLDLLVTYGSAVFAEEEEDDSHCHHHHHHHRRWAALLHHGHDHDPDGAAASARPRSSRLKASLRGRLYGRVTATPLEARRRLTAAAALHHPRDLRWILDPARGNVLGGEQLDVAGFLRRVGRKIKHDEKSTKNMKVAAMRALCEGVVAAGLLPTTGAGAGGKEPVLRVDLSSMGMDDACLEHVLVSLWDVTATGVPTALLLDNNALTDVGVRALVLQYRANMAAAAPRANHPKGGRAAPVSPLGHSAVSASGAGDVVAPHRATSPLSAAGSAHSGGGGHDLAAYAGHSHLGGSAHRQPPRAPSLVALSLNGNEVGTDGALFLADLVADSHAALASVTVYKTECHVGSPTSLAFDRVVDRSLSLEAALVVALLVDAYVGLRRFVFTLREADGPLPLPFARLNLLNELDLRGNDLEGPLLPSLLLVHRKHVGGGNRLGLPWDGLQELEHAVAIDCAKCGLTGPIPESWGRPRAFPALKSLDLSDNPALEGPVPAGK